VFTVLLFRLYLDFVLLDCVLFSNACPFSLKLILHLVELQHSSREPVMFHVKFELVSSVILFTLKLVLVGRVESL